MNRREFLRLAAMAAPAAGIGTHAPGAVCSSIELAHV
jgi:hypothetical protein